MSNIVERLRTSTEWAHCKHSMREEAAAEIERLHKIELQFLALQEERVRWFADNEWLTADNERLRALLAEMPDLIKDIDGGNPETNTGWASEELLDLWMRVRRALEPKPFNTKES